MRDFPTTFATETRYMGSTDMNQAGQSSLSKLFDKGYHIQIGILERDVSQLQALSRQTSILKYCPKDCTERFKDTPTTQKWLTKKRLVFLLKERATDDVAGIAWTGPGTSPNILGGTLTGGIRISEKHQGKGLAAPFLQAELEYTKQFFSDDLLWFECWQSNAGAAHIYQKIGFKIVGTEPGQRVTPSGDYEPDTRVYMVFDALQNQ